LNPIYFSINIGETNIQDDKKFQAFSEYIIASSKRWFYSGDVKKLIAIFSRDIYVCIMIIVLDNRKFDATRKRIALT
jgi:hypothetical protein